MTTSDAQTAQLWQPPSLRVVNPVADKLTFEQQQEQSRQQGYQEGLQQGLQAGREQAKEMLAQISALMDAMQQPFADMEHDVHSHLMGLSTALALSILERELKTDEALIRSALEKALAALGTTQGTIEVTVSPQDADLVQSLAGEEHDTRIKASPSMLPGGCKVQRGSSLVDASIESLIGDALNEVAERSRVTDAAGNETARALDPEQIQAITNRFLKQDDAD